MNDNEILDHMVTLRESLMDATDGLKANDYPELLIACSIFIAGFDAMLAMRKHD